MKKESCWLSVSIFVSKNNWNILLKKAIAPLLNTLFNSFEIALFKLQFDYIGGENIQLSIYANRNHAQIVAQNIDTHFIDFFKEEQMLPIYKSAPYDSVFMPFPQNIVAYGLYNVPISTDFDFIVPIQHTLSEVILSALSLDSIDDEAILTFALYIVFSCYRVVSTKRPLFKERLKLFYNQSHTEINIPVNQQFIQNKYDQLTCSIEDIYQDIMSNDISLDLLWLNKWNDTLSQALYELGENDDVLFFKKIILFVNKQLGLNDLSSELLNTFVKKTILKQINT